MNIIADNHLRIDLLQRVAAPPPLFEPGEPLFWDDPHISAQMLAAHLDPAVDAASRRPEVINRTVGWLLARLALRPGDALLDLGCGPGLYCARFAAHGLRVTGVDYSQRSIEYARRAAQEQGLAIDYIYQNYLELDYTAAFTAAVLIYGDFCTLADGDRDRVLANIHRALVPGGRFAFDVMTLTHRSRFGPRTAWSAHASGFWRPGPHLVLEQRHDYPDADSCLERYLVIEEGGALADYRNWYHLYSADTIRPVLERAGFRLREVWSDLIGTPYDPASEWLGLVAEKV
jgi:SAM-dependent methyltransferase